MQSTTEGAVSSLNARFASLREALSTRVIGQPGLVHRLLVALLADGHLLVEGAPGLAKTTAIKTLAQHLEVSFQRIQFTPDLLPADLTGTDVFRPQEGRFEFQPGPLFHNFLLADEVNRAPAKVQSALLEAMGERQITAGGRTYPLPRLFLVMATQNPIEQEGTYALPEAQLDRFLLQVRIDYPEAEAEARILQLARAQARGEAAAAGPCEVRLSEDEVLAARRAVLEVHMAPAVEAYLLELVQASRGRSRYGTALQPLLAYGASPRATIALDRTARANAWLDGRDYVTPEDVRELAVDVLQHRLLPSYEAQAEGLDGAELARRLLDQVPAP
ncbi:MAG: ATPase AAA [Lysobacteraceae bacterium]|nr:MAG: ATPase AAA [Xanthomonadaceae bacterium]